MLLQMGSSGAGKTTLLDVLSGRSNSGVVTGTVFVNGKPKDARAFKRIMGYVEQFDSLSPRDTAREAVEFSAALRLPRSTSKAFPVLSNWLPIRRFCSSMSLLQAWIHVQRKW